MKKIMSFIFRCIGEDKKKNIEYILSFIYLKQFKEWSNKKKIVYLLTPNHGNMGDQAIAYATQKYLSDNFSEYDILELHRDEIYKYGKSIKKILKKDDLIFLHGGGNLGNLYINEEQVRRFIIEKFPDNKIISMTQTISFTKDNEGKKELKKTKEIYNKHKNLTIIAREKTSFNIMRKELVNCKIIENPDVVFYLHNTFKDELEKRKNIMTCLRSDKESVLGENKRMFLEELCSKYNNVYEYDTVIHKGLDKFTREKELNDMFNKFSRSKVVITDRLHGMVFCVITKTPCIVTKSLDHKVTGTYEWVKELNYIKLVDKLDFNIIESVIDELINLKDKSEINFKKKYFCGLKYRILK